MAIHIYNTLTRKKERFEPVHPGKVGMYVCGPTVYDSCHIGHARSVVVFDVIARYFRARGYAVTYVRNFTDVDDKIINKARQMGIESQAVADKYIKEFYADMDALKVERATVEPRATEHIQQIIEFIEKLIAGGFAYQIDGDVYYAVETFENYGVLSRRRLEDMEAGARVDIDDKKRNPFDFVLWKSAKPGEPAWESPWGKGRPGWHIECSAMSHHYLGENFDIHGGGKDLNFPHHENEIAQSESLFGKPFVKYWVHNGFVNIDQEKMSKSLGNFMMIKDVLKTYHPEVIRLFLLSNHYRSPIDFTDKAMDEARSGLDKIYALLDRIDETTGGPADQDVDTDKCWKLFCEAMDDDFNTARGIGIIFETVRNLNRLLDENVGQLLPETELTVRAARSDLIRAGNILGIITEPPKSYFAKRRSESLQQQSLDPALVEKMVKERDAARKAKNWKAADQLRKQLHKMNVVLEDRPEGTIWKIIN